jgi:hypothetical protein
MPRSTAIYAFLAASALALPVAAGAQQQAGAAVVVDDATVKRTNEKNEKRPVYPPPQ